MQIFIAIFTCILKIKSQRINRKESKKNIQEKRFFAMFCFCSFQKALPLTFIRAQGFTNSLFYSDSTCLTYWVFSTPWWEFTVWYYIGTKKYIISLILKFLLLDPSQAPDLTFSDGPYGSNSKVKVNIHAINKTRWGGPPYGYHFFYKPVANMTVEENNTNVDEWDLSTSADENGFM